jgi:F-type H+-transporting ATPase subunit epsilon
MLHLNIITPNEVLIKEDVLSIIVPGKMGDMQILPGHAAILSETIPGEVIFEKSTREKITFKVSQGVLMVEKDEVNLLCDKII